MRSHVTKFWCLYGGAACADVAPGISNPSQTGTHRRPFCCASYRENGKVRKRTLCNLSDWPVAHIEGLRGVLQGGTVIAAQREAFTVLRTLPHGHVAAALGTARKIGLDRVLGPDGDRCRDLILALLVA